MINPSFRRDGVKTYLNQVFMERGGYVPFYASYLLHKKGEFGQAMEIAKHYEVSRETVYKWIRREDEDVY